MAGGPRLNGSGRGLGPAQSRWCDLRPALPLPQASVSPAPTRTHHPPTMRLLVGWRLSGPKKRQSWQAAGQVGWGVCSTKPTRGFSAPGSGVPHPHPPPTSSTHPAASGPLQAMLRVPAPPRALHLGHLLYLSSSGTTHPTPSWDLPAPRRVPLDLRPSLCLAHPATLPTPFCERVTPSCREPELAPDPLCSRHAARTEARLQDWDNGSSSRGACLHAPDPSSTPPRAPARGAQHPVVAAPTPLPPGPDGQLRE